jgi:cation:H+ antiporter
VLCCWDLQLSRLEGIVLLAGLGALLAWMGSQSDKPGAPSDVMGLEFADEIPVDMPLGRALLWLIVGLALLLASSRLLVWAAVSIAQALGVSDLVIGLTVVALGTSLPELAASMASARKGEYDIAIGNVIGSNMFNLLGVMGLAGTIAPYRMETATLYRDFPVMGGLTVAFFAMAYGFSGQGRISRLEGLALVLAYLAYQILLYMTATP